MSSAEPARRRWIVGAVKIPYAARDVAHAVISSDDDRGFLDMIGADAPDDHDVFPVGAHTTYAVELTDDEAERFRAASNCRYVEPDDETRSTAGAALTPAASSMRFMNADFPRIDQFHGRDVLIAICDGGTTQAVRDYLGATMVARQVFSTDQPGADEITSAHGCEVAACCLPRGGKFLDVITTDNDGTGSVSGAVAGARWAADNGAKVINYSSGATSDNTAWHDMAQYLLDRGVQFFSTTGNDGQNITYYPGGLSASYANVHCAIAFDEQTGQRASFSNYVATASGCAPGVNVLAFLPDGRLGVWNGTSAAAPHMALLCAMGMTGGRFTGPQMGAALKANTRKLAGVPTAEQGGGAYDLQAALTALGAFNNLPAQQVRRNLAPNPSVESDTSGFGLRSVRTGITATVAGRSNTIATPCGSFYFSVNVTGDGTTNATTPDVEINLPSMPVTAGQTYTWSVHSRHQVLGPSLQWAVQWQNDAGANLGTFAGATTGLISTLWVRYLMTLTAPAGATRAVPWLRGFGFTATTAGSWRIDGLLYEQGDIGPYFDGASTGAKWDATANLSTSTLGTAAVSGADYHPVAIIWPASENSNDGEFDFMENGRPGDDHAEAFLHYPRPAGASLSQEHVTKAGVDLSQWHHFAFEKSSDGITGYLDGVQWFHYAGGAITGQRKNIQDMPSGHLTLQLDNFTGSSGLIPATMEIDWVKVYSLTPASGGGGGGGGSTGTLADRLRLGAGDGLTKTNLGIDFLPNDGPSGKKGQHVDYALPVLVANTLPAEFAGYCDLRDNGAVRLTAYVGAATTPNSTHSRTEFRELAANGVDKALWSSSSGTHYVWVRGSVIRKAPGRPHVVLAQIHDASDDVATIRMEGTTVVATYGDTGRPGTLATGVTDGSVHEWMLKTIRSGSNTIIQYFFDDMTTPKATQSYGGGSGCYFKAGNYQQSSTSTDSQGDTFVVDLFDLEMWHTGYAEPTARH